MQASTAVFASTVLIIQSHEKKNTRRSQRICGLLKGHRRVFFFKNYLGAAVKYRGDDFIYFNFKTGTLGPANPYRPNNKFGRLSIVIRRAKTNVSRCNTVYEEILRDYSHGVTLGPYTYLGGPTYGNVRTIDFFLPIKLN